VRRQRRSPSIAASSNGSIAIRCDRHQAAASGAAGQRTPMPLLFVWRRRTPCLAPPQLLASMACRSARGGVSRRGSDGTRRRNESSSWDA
jgi:hypothetical protein